jgi:hypothetical protein
VRGRVRLQLLPPRPRPPRLAYSRLHAKLLQDDAKGMLLGRSGLHPSPRLGGGRRALRISVSGLLCVLQ